MLFSILASPVAVAVPALLSGGGITVSLDENATVTGLRVADTELSVTPGPLVTLCDVKNGIFHAPAAIEGTWQDGLLLRFPQCRADLELRISADQGALRFSCTLTGADTLARGMLLRFAFPFDAQDWLWHEDMQNTIPIQEQKLYENVRPLRAYADLPEWKDAPAIRMGYSNRNFCTVLTGPVGICLAVPIDRPCIFRTGYDAAEKRLEILYDFALSPHTRTPNEVRFAFDLYQCDPDWGFRSALQHYYGLYPELFKVHIRKQGQWLAFSRLSLIDNANEFGFALQEGAPEPEYDNKLDVLSTVYFTHAGMGARIPDYDPENDPLPPYEVQVKALEEAFKRRTGREDMFARVGLYTAEGKLDVRKWRVYAHLIAQFNLDPELEYGAWTLERAVSLTEDIKQKKGATLDGFYYDGLSSGINYRQEHFRTADAPCLWDPVAEKPFINNFFSSCEFSRAAAELLRPRGQITMMNGALGSSFFVAPWLDVLGAETGLRIPRESLNYMRTTTYHKPFMTLLKGNYEKMIGHADIELFMKRCLAYGIFPGFFDWSPSGLGPGGRYWDHPRYYERDRDVFRKYQPLCHALATAGWEPLTYARSSHPDLHVERFGPGPDGVTWFSLLNETAETRRGRLTIETGPLDLDPATVEALDMVSGAAVPLERDGDRLRADIEVPADGVIALHVADRVAAALWRVEQALETLDRGLLMRDVDRDKPPVAVHWIPQPGSAPYSREKVGEHTSLVLTADGKESQSCSQWAMLFQPETAALTLRVRVRGTELDGKKEHIGIRCRLARVTSSFTHYETRFFELPTGTYEWRDLEFVIESEYALRSIHLTPTLVREASGSLSIARISLADRHRDEYVIDPTFREWYEPVPEELQTPLRAGCNALRTRLLALREALPQLPPGAGRPGLAGYLARSKRRKASEPVRRELLAAFAEAESLRDLVARADAHNGARRVLRDLQTIEQHLGAIVLTAFDLPAPSISGPLTAAAGDSVQLSMPVPTTPDATTTAEFRINGKTVPLQRGGAEMVVPHDATPGQTLRVEGLVNIMVEGRTAAVKAIHPIRVVEPLDIEMEDLGMDPVSGRCGVRILLRNHRAMSATVQLTPSVPEGWHVAPPGDVTIPARSETSLELALEPTDKAGAGTVEVGLLATSANVERRCALTMLYIPKEANLLGNPGFEDGTTGWSLTKGKVEVVTTVARSGNAALRIENPTPADRTGASQTVKLQQDTPCALLVRASSKAENVSGTPSKGYSVYVDTYFQDGTPLYGQTYEFNTGTTDWQMGQVYIEPDRPVQHVTVHLLLRGKSGVVYFDDVAISEDPRRKGNIARAATVEVDSSYSRYHAGPINDGIIREEGLHWTEQAWASADTEQPHFIVLTFPEPQTIARAAIYWSQDAGIARTSAEVRLQVPDGASWRTVAIVEPASPTPLTTITLDTAVTAERFRLYQPRGKGSRDRPNLMWVREVELFPAEQE